MFDFFFHVVLFLENYYFGKGWRLSHGRGFTHVFCNLKPESEANSSTAMTGSHLNVEMLSTHMCPHARLFFLFYWKVLGQRGCVDRTQQGESLPHISKGLLFNLWMLLPKKPLFTDYIAADLQLLSLKQIRHGMS